MAMKFTEKLFCSSLLGLVALGTLCDAAQAKYNELPLDHCGIYYSKTYPHQAVHKAIATSNGAAPGINMACGFSYNWPSKSAAVAEALRICRKHRVAGILETRCKIYDAK